MPLGVKERAVKAADAGGVLIRCGVSSRLALLLDLARAAPFVVVC